MPTLRLFGQPCRVRPLLDAIGAQEALEGHCARQRVMQSPSQIALSVRQQHGLSRRRNRTESRLRDEERKAFYQWRASPPAVRAATYSMLTDLPTAEERNEQEAQSGVLATK